MHLGWKLNIPCLTAIAINEVYFYMNRCLPYIIGSRWGSLLNRSCLIFRFIIVQCSFNMTVHHHIHNQNYQLVTQTIRFSSCSISASIGEMIISFCNYSGNGSVCKHDIKISFTQSQTYVCSSYYEWFPIYFTCQTQFKMAPDSTLSSNQQSSLAAAESICSATGSCYRYSMHSFSFNWKHQSWSCDKT